MAGAGARRHEPPVAVPLPSLTPFAGASLEDRGDYEAILFADLELIEQAAENAAFSSCRFERCRLNGSSLRRARIATTMLVDSDATSVDAADSSWRDAVVDGGRFGALTLSGATLTDVRLRRIKVDFLDLSHARLLGVVLEDCVIGELELADAHLRWVRIDGGAIEVLNAGSARLEDVDLSATRLRTIGGVASLRGATISAEQLIDVAPLLAIHLGIRVRSD